MPRKAFMADLAAATQGKIPCISNIVRGEEDGEIEFTYTPVSGAEPIVVTILSGDVSEYPGTGNPYYLSTTSHTVPEVVNKTLESHAESSLGMTIEQLLSGLSKALQKAYSTGTKTDPIPVDNDGDVEMGDEPDISDEEVEDGDESDSYYDPYGGELSDDGFEHVPSKLDAQTAAKMNSRIRQDVQAVKQAGFKVGIINGMIAGSNTSLLCISIRASKLGLSDEALQAWGLKKDQYVVLLIRYVLGYKSFDFIIANAATQASNGIEFRVGLCNRYKPTASEALAAFSEVKRDTSSKNEELPVDGQTGLSSLFISSSLNDFFNTQFIPMMKYREKLGVSWDGAKLVYNRQQGTGNGEYPEHLPDEYFQNDIPTDKVLPEIALGDHLAATSSASERSFPLISMQFLMRYFIRCPEFCLICHDKTTETFEALKPYVCSRGLCLFQYMQLGFGPSIEHEIISQPYVVDLLISFCYAAARGHRIRTYPLGQFIGVPPRDRSDEIRGSSSSQFQGRGVAPTPPVQPETVQPSKFWDVKFDAAKREVVFDNPDIERGVVRVHDWVVVDVMNSEPVHYRVVNVTMFPTIQLSENGITRSMPRSSFPEESESTRPGARTETPVTTPPSSCLVAARFSKYDRQFDQLSDLDKADSIVMLLETLPKVTEMRDYLCQESSVKEPRLSNWTDRITQSSLTLLRWIISSNRSIICQVDGVPGQTQQQLLDSGVRLDDKVTGMNDWMQFRFAQGAPDKEQRFRESLDKARTKLKNQSYPTLFAWHGSPLANWHSIIRSGLDYNETINGRAYGHGCYFASDLNTSLSYSSFRGDDSSWPGSQLHFSTAFAMAEIVNVPHEYQSSHPYLVVQNVDWIQCRYLFVGKFGQAPIVPYTAPSAPSGNDQQKSMSNAPVQYIEQDPGFTMKNASNQIVGIPVHAIATRKAMNTTSMGAKRSKSSTSSTPSTSANPPLKKLKSLWSSKQKELPELPDPAVYDTDETDIDDLSFLTRTDESDSPAQSSKGKRKAGADPAASSSPLTDFVPGTLDPASLQLMAEPSYAENSATVQLARALKVALKTEKDTPAHELGWSIDERFTDNLYQWIVELHSFDAELELAKDMKKAGVKSVVLEIRFGANFPFSPPFVRVIRPRFLPFMSGGGGHVTAGGALCMELLTSSGWSAVNTIESVLMQVRLAISSTEPKPARLQSTSKSGQWDYGVGEAMEAFVRACNTHGWQVPSDFKQLREGAAASSRFMDD